MRVAQSWQSQHTWPYASVCSLVMPSTLSPLSAMPMPARQCSVHDLTRHRPMLCTNSNRAAHDVDDGSSATTSPQSTSAAKMPGCSHHAPRTGDGGFGHDFGCGVGADDHDMGRILRMDRMEGNVRFGSYPHLFSQNIRLP